MRTLTLHSWETRRYVVTAVTESDPSLDTFEVAAVATDAVDEDPGAWTAGSWNGAYSDGRIDAYTPTLGTSESAVTPDIELTEGKTYRVYGRVRSGSDAPGELVAVLDVT